MTEFHFTYMCSKCNLVINLLQGICTFYIGPFKVVLFDDYDLNTPMVRTYLYKNFQLLQLDTELPVNITEEQLHEIWDKHRW